VATPALEPPSLHDHDFVQFRLAEKSPYAQARFRTPPPRDGLFVCSVSGSSTRRWIDNRSEITLADLVVVARHPVSRSNSTRRRVPLNHFGKRTIVAPGRLRSILLVSGLVTQQFDFSSAIAADASNGNDTVTRKQSLTPGGFRPESEVHKIAPGNVLDASGGRLRELDADGNVVADFGPAPVATAPRAVTPGATAPKKRR
jgi:hypothetical protein